MLLAVDEVIDMARTSRTSIGTGLASVVIAQWEGVFGAERDVEQVTARGASDVSLGGVDEEEIIPIRVPPSRVPTVSRFRSTWLTSSVLSLQKRGLIERYLTFLPKEDHAAVLYAPPASWIETALVVRHYEACDSLKLPTVTLLEIGRDVVQRFHASSLAVARGFAAAAGMTPWTILRRLDALWSRAMVGGAVGVTKLGPKEARIELLGFPVSHIEYNRIATRGIIHGLVELFCTKVWVHEMSRMCSRLTLGYRVQWA
jgi:hypothetical protein